MKHVHHNVHIWGAERDRKVCLCVCVLVRPLEAVVWDIIRKHGFTISVLLCAWPFALDEWFKSPTWHMSRGSSVLAELHSVR